MKRRTASSIGTQKKLEEQQRKDEVMKDVSDFPEVKQQHEDIPIYAIMRNG